MDNVVAIDSFRDPAREINREHELAATAEKDFIKHAIRCGELLIAQKDSLKHGEFMPWVKANCTFSYETAKSYMNASKNQKGTSGTFLSLNKLKHSAKGPKPQGYIERAIRAGIAPIDIGGEQRRKVRDEICKRAGFSAIPRVHAMTLEASERMDAAIQAIAAENVVTTGRQTLSDDFQTRFDTALAQARLEIERESQVRLDETLAKLQASFVSTVNAEVERRLPDQARLDIESARIKAANASYLEGVWRTRAAACKEVITITLAGWRTMTMCLHPDRAPPERQEQFAKATETVLRLKDAIDRIEHGKW